MDTGGGKLAGVSQYKYLRGIIDISGSLVPEARRRARSAMTSFAPLSIKMFGSKSISVAKRTLLAQSLVMSRLFSNVHVCGTLSGKPRNILNAMYTKVWRRIADQHLNGKRSVVSGLEV